jgi:hypothetical protein
MISPLLVRELIALLAMLFLGMMGMPGISLDLQKSFMPSTQRAMW